MLHLQQPPLSLSERGHLGLVTAPFAASEQSLLCANSLEKNLSRLDARKAPSTKCTFLEGAPDPFVPFLPWVYGRAPTVPAVWMPYQGDFPLVTPASKEWHWSDPCAKPVRLSTPQGTPESLLTDQSFPTSPAWIHREGWHFFFLSTCGMLTVGLLL